MPISIELTDEQAQNFRDSYNYMEHVIFMCNIEEDEKFLSGYYEVASLIYNELNKAKTKTC